MKYAMPVDPRVLQKDYPSDPSLDTIPELVLFLKSLTTKDFKNSTSKASWKIELSDKIHNLWYTINYEPLKLAGIYSSEEVFHINPNFSATQKDILSNSTSDDYWKRKQREYKPYKFKSID